MIRPLLLVAALVAAGTATAQGPFEDCPPLEFVFTLVAHEGCAVRGDATITQGDVDHFSAFFDACGSLLQWRGVRLTLLDPLPGDEVLLAGYSAVGLPGIAVATHEQPTAEVGVYQIVGCHPGAVLVGLAVTGERVYRIEFL